MAIELNKNINLIIRLRLVRKGDNEPVHGSNFNVRLYDRDVFADDFLGESAVTDGVASFTITKNDFTSPLGMDENPDFYFVVYHGGKEIFKSKVMEDLDLANIEGFVMRQGEVIDLGTYLIDTQV